MSDVVSRQGVICKPEDYESAVFFHSGHVLPLKRSKGLREMPGSVDILYQSALLYSPTSGIEARVLERCGKQVSYATGGCAISSFCFIALCKILQAVLLML